MKPMAYNQKAKPNKSRLLIRKVTGRHDYLSTIVSVDGQKRCSTLNQTDINLLAAFLDNWRTDKVPLGHVPTDWHVDKWLYLKTQELKKKGQL